MAAAIAPGSSRLATSFGAIGVLLGVARVAAGVHYPSDVLAGALLGTVIGSLTRRVQ
jgi:undecaprenyl-diphosphatase